MIQVFFRDLRDDGPEIAVLSVEPAFVFLDEALEIMKEYPVENGALRMARAVDSRHKRREESRNRPGREKGRTSGVAGRS